VLDLNGLDLYEMLFAYIATAVHEYVAIIALSDVLLYVRSFLMSAYGHIAPSVVVSNRATVTVCFRAVAVATPWGWILHLETVPVGESIELMFPYHGGLSIVYVLERFEEVYISVAFHFEVHQQAFVGDQDLCDSHGLPADGVQLVRYQCPYSAFESFRIPICTGLTVIAERLLLLRE
jgi:hypothetical protein